MKFIYSKEKSDELPDEKSLSKSSSDFAMDLYNQLKTTDGNIAISPFSIFEALQMLYAGARSETRAQIARILHISDENDRFLSVTLSHRYMPGDGPISLITANSLWPAINYQLQNEYLSIIQTTSGAAVFPVDYRDPDYARAKINHWVEEYTQKMICEVIPSGFLSAMTQLVLVNAIYFKGNWKYQFNHELTHETSFRISYDRSLTVSMMTVKDNFRYGQLSGFKMLELPYSGDGLSMILLLPDNVDGLSELENELSTENLNHWTKGMQLTEVEVFLPRFEVTLPLRLDGTLIELGMIDAFSNNADFSGMEKQPLYISAILHKTYIAVNEEGTEAAASTAVIVARSIPRPSPVFRCDHPFIYLIRENKSGVILFMGRFSMPST